MIKAILFDLDNTLVDFLRLKSVCSEQAVDAMIDAGLKISRKKALDMIYEIYDQTTMEDDKVFQKLLRKLSGKIDYRILTHGIIAYRKAKMGFISPYPGTKQTLIRLKEKGFKLAIVTDAPRMKAWNRLCSMSLDDFFDIVVCFEDTGKLKPNKEPFLLALKRLKLKPNQAIYVGDNPNRDIKGAKKAGIKTIYASYGNKRTIKAIKPDYVINNIRDIVDIV